MIDLDLLIDNEEDRKHFIMNIIIETIIQLVIVFRFGYVYNLINTESLIDSNPIFVLLIFILSLRLDIHLAKIFEIVFLDKFIQKIANFIKNKINKNKGDVKK